MSLSKVERGERQVRRLGVLNELFSLAPRATRPALAIYSFKRRKPRKLFAQGLTNRANRTIPDQAGIQSISDPEPGAPPWRADERRHQRERTLRPEWFEADVIHPIEDFKDPQQEWRRLFSEALGTFFLVLVAAGGGMMSQAFPATFCGRPR